MALRESMEKQGNWFFKWRSYLPLLFIPLFLMALKEGEYIERVFGERIGDFWETFAVMVSFSGLVVRCFTAGYVPRGTSGRNTKSQVAEKLNITGMYSITRNPLYLGNYLIIFGITLFIQVWWLAFFVWVGFWLYYERIIFSEEEFLRKKFGGEFIVWAQKTPIIIPNFRNWRKPDLPFSFKTVLRREFSTYFAIVAVFFFLELAGGFLEGEGFSVHNSWLIFFLVSTVIYFTLLFFKKKTRVLDVNGR
ncbi:MAG: isoprenylcysteine carboxylmethyltransferase family protein [Candidatus Omnitrophica bacterium]|nr:isoprenylcysteine carboxylmethyltransferase family protein [Candidatus Omnitrophota bacterium]